MDQTLISYGFSESTNNNLCNETNIESFHSHDSEIIPDLIPEAPSLFNEMLIDLIDKIENNNLILKDIKSISRDISDLIVNSVEQKEFRLNIRKIQDIDSMLHYLKSFIN